MPPSKGPARRRPVFYNPAMALDRDLNVAIVRAALPADAAARGLDLLAATGVRGLRLVQESERFRSFVFCDGNPSALVTCRRNTLAVRPASTGVVALDARRPGLKGPFDYVDVDPYGSPVPFLDPAIALVAPGGLLAVTATDMPVLAGAATGVAERRYGGRPVRGRLGPEVGLRLLLAHLARRARAHGLQARPVASYVHDHHVRAFLRLGPVDDAVDPIGLLDVGQPEGPRLPPGGPYGPCWLGPLFDRSVAERLGPPATPARPGEVERWILRFQEEAPVPGLLYHEPNELARALHLPEPPSPERVIAELRAAGYPAARSHVREAAIRTLAPRAEVEAAARTAAARRPN